MNPDRPPRHRRAVVTGDGSAVAAAPFWAIYVPLDPARGCLALPFRAGAVALPRGAGPAATRRRWVDVVDGDRYAWHQVLPPPAAPGAADQSGQPGRPGRPGQPGRSGPLRGTAPDEFNEQAFVLTARLGYVDVADRIGLHTDLLLVGLTPAGRPADVPPALLDVVYRCGLTVELPQRRPGEHPLPLTARPATVTRDVELLQRVLRGLRRHREQGPSARRG